MNSSYPASTQQTTVGATGMPSSEPFMFKAMFRLLAATSIVCLIGLVYFGYREWQAAQNLSDLLQKINSEDHEFSDASSGSIPNPNEAVVAWSKVCVLSRNAMPGMSYLNQLPFIGQDTRVNFEPGQPWKEEPFVAETLEYLRPILDHLELAAEYPFPSPASSQPGWNRWSDHNLFQYLIQILRLEISFAIYHQDHSRALRGLRLLLKMGQQPNRRNDFAYDIVLCTQHLAVLATLANTDWTENEIKEIEEMLTSVSSLDDKLKNAAIQTRRELADHLTAPGPSISGYPELEPCFVSLPSYRLRTLANVDQMVRDIQEPEFRASFVREATQAYAGSLQRNDALLVKQYLLVSTFVSSEYARRLAITGLALKRFQMSHGKWPKELSELKPLGLTESDYSTLSGKMFEYEVGVLRKEELELLQLSGHEDAAREYAWLWIPGDELPGTRPSIHQALQALSASQPNDTGSRFPAYRIR